MCLQIPLKDINRKINFDELPKINSRIKIITIKIMRFWTKVLKCNFSNLNGKVLGFLQKLTKAIIKIFYAYIFVYIQ